MGQRSQLIAILPAVYYNEGNPNNKPQRRVVVYHNQWLYGYSFLKYIKRLMVGLEFSKAKKDHILTGWVEEGLKKAIDYANHSDLEYPTNTHPYDDGDLDYNKKLVKAESVLKFLKAFDNNNGYIFILLDKGGNAKFGILNGYEDADVITSRTPQDYLNLFYLPSEQTDEMKAAVEALDVYEPCDAFKELEKLKAEVGK